MMKKLDGSDQKIQSKLVVESLKDLTDQGAVEEVTRSLAAVSQSYQPLDLTKMPSYLPAQEPEQKTIFEVFEKIKTLKKTRSILPIDLPDRLRIECAIDLAEPLTDIFNSCLKNTVFPAMWRWDWVSALPKKPNRELLRCTDFRKKRLSI